MILVDTSVWIDYLRDGDEVLARVLKDGKVLLHPFVIGEVALGSLRQRQTILSHLQDLPQAPVAEPREVLHLIEQNSLSGLGIGYVDAHLLASVCLAPGTSLFTRDKRLSAVADRLQVSASSLH